ncbi:hypothetical protein [Mangrovimonas sp. CR14]|uniref:hypothetical protein n=1 Tax=Mangrovimonas sp. CR14 TaxID=2706120 RepID=UPI00141F0D54|nr:hypothetical protein [Mangrovimonas sp. CR14]
MNLTKTENKTQLTEKSETIFWIDTISNGKFLKIYSKPENDSQNLIAEFGDETKKHTIDLKVEEYEMFGIPFTNQIEWITEKSFALIDGCGTNCRYVTIFNTTKSKPTITQVDYFPNMSYGNFESDNENLYVKVDWDFGKYIKLSIIDTDTQKQAKFDLPKCWTCEDETGEIYGMLHSLTLKDNTIIVSRHSDNKEDDILSGELIWK